MEETNEVVLKKVNEALEQAEPYTRAVRANMKAAWVIDLTTRTLVDIKENYRLREQKIYQEGKNFNQLKSTCYAIL